MNGDGSLCRPVPTEIEPNLDEAPGWIVHGRKYPFSGRLDCDPLEIPAGTGPIRDRVGYGTVLVDRNADPYRDVTADGVTSAR